MLKSIAKTALAVMATSCLLYESAKAADWTVKVTPQNSPVGAPVIEVESDGEEWTHIRSATKQVKLSTDVKVNTGWRVVRVYLGFPSADFCYSGVGAPLPEECTTIYDGKTKYVNLDGREYDFSTDHIGGIDKQAIVNACNAGDHDPTQQREPFESQINVGIKAYIPRRSETNDPHEGDYGRTETAYARVPVIVRCLGVPSNLQAPPKPFSVDVQVEQKGETCPKQTDVTAIIKYKVPATARFRFKVDGKLSKLYEIKARKVEPYKPQPVPGGGGYYLVKRLKTYHLDPGQTHFRVVMEDGSGKKSAVKTVKIDCPPFKVFSSWLKYDVEDTPVCDKEVKEVATFKSTRPGSAPFRIKTQGGLVVNSGTAKFKRKGREYVAKIKRTLMMGAFDSDMMAEITTDPAANSGWTRLKVGCLDVKGDFSFIDNGGTRCPREGKALINFSMNIKADIHYSLDCTNGHFSGIAKAVPGNSGGYVAPALVRFDIKKTKQVTCALKSVAPGKTKVHTLKGHLFRCVIPSGVSGTNDLKPETRPVPDAPRNPGIIVIDPPRPPRTPDKVVIDPPRTPSDSVPPTYPVPPGGKGGSAANVTAIDTGKGGKDSSAVDATPGYGKKTRADAEADRKRLEALKKRQQKLEAEKRRAAMIAAQKAAEQAKLRQERLRKLKAQQAAKARAERLRRQKAKQAAEARKQRQKLLLQQQNKRKRRRAQ